MICFQYRPMTRRFGFILYRALDALVQVYPRRHAYPFRYQSVVILHPGKSMSVSKRF